MANTSNNSYPILPPPTYKHEIKHQNFPKVNCGLYALCKILLNAPCLFSAKSSINLSWHKSYKGNWVPVEGPDSVFFGLTQQDLRLFLSTLGVSLGARMIPSCGRPVTQWKEGCHLVFVVFLSCALKICRDEWVS